MAEFIAAPRPPAERIPVITVQDLIDALALYLPAISNCKFAYATNRIDCDREFEYTTIVISGQPSDDGSPPPFFKIEISDKAAGNVNSRLWNTPFAISISGPSIHGGRFIVQIEPRVGRSIAIRRVLRFENGYPVFDPRP